MQKITDAGKLKHHKGESERQGSARVWGRCQVKRSKTPVQSTGLYISRCQRKLISHRQMTETCVALPHKDLRKTSCSLQGAAQLTLAYDIMHCSPGETMSSYDELVCFRTYSEIMESHCFNMSGRDFNSCWRDAE